MYRYRLFVKDCFDLSGKTKSDIVCLSFDVKRDLLEKSVSTFNLEYIDTNIDIGDVCGLYDDYGTIYYVGVVDEIDRSANQITCTSNISYFRYMWLYDPLRSEIGSTESLIKKEFENTFINSSDYLMNKKYSDIQIQLLSDELDYQIPLQEDNYTEDFEDFLYKSYENFGIVCDFGIDFKSLQPTLTIDGKVGDRQPIKIGNNYNKIQNFNIQTDTFENNKLIIYSKDGLTKRGEYFGTTGGITQDDESPLRLKKVNNVIVFSDDELDLIVAQNLQDNMYNHKITFDMILDNSFYDFFTLFKLGCPIEIWYNGIYFNSVFTGYEFVKENEQEISKVSITCGKVRNSLTSKILKYVR